VLSFANVYFLESGLFNELRPIQIKNFRCLASMRVVFRQLDFSRFQGFGSVEGRSGFGQPKVYKDISKLPRFCSPLLALGGGILRLLNSFRSQIHPDALAAALGLEGARPVAAMG
jgi:hypothetical protein